MIVAQDGWTVAVLEMAFAGDADITPERVASMARRCGDDAFALRVLGQWLLSHTELVHAGPKAPQRFSLALYEPTAWLAEQTAHDACEIARLIALAWAEGDFGGGLDLRAPWRTTPEEIRQHARTQVARAQGSMTA